jgi:EAL domain-containing protein (putative c-di-GMP-specific phosphodiesterase class I)
MILEGMIMLVVEDHDFQRRTVARMLRTLGAQEVLEASDGKQALALIRGSTSIDLVVCDLDMPEMDGMEFIRHLGQAEMQVSVIISSAKELALLDSVEKMAKAYGVQLLGTIEKPVNLMGIKKLVARHGTSKPKVINASVSTPSFNLEQILHGLQLKQFESFFQPKLELASGQLVGAEALARWRHPEHGLIAPYAFIALLEQNKKIDELTFAMLEKTAIECRTWREYGLELTVSVNLSLASLTDTMLADRITQIVRTAGLDPKHMVLEITETAAMTEVAYALENLARLRMRGFGLSIDDYGTGYSSMQQLARIPFTELKIDQSFVTGSVVNKATRAIVESSVGMARSMGIKSVAEGVETQADWDAMKATGCNVAQGYFIAKPMDAKSFLEFCRVYKPG